MTFDVNQVINPTLAIRLDGMWQNANVAERNDTYDDRGGALAAIKWTPNNSFKVTANYVHTNLWSLPDFGVPYNNVEGAPVTSLGVPRDTYYGFDNRDFQKVQQDFGTVDSEYIVNDFVTLNNKIRDEQSILNYIGTIPEQSTSCNGTATTLAGTNPANWTVCLNPVSRYQVTTVQANESSATIKFATGPVKNTVVTGAEVDYEKVSIDSYNGLASEAVGPGAFNGAGSYGPVSVLNPPNDLAFGTSPTLTGNPTVNPVMTKSGYVLETANYHDFIILNGGVRFDQYNVAAKKSGAEISTAAGMWKYNLGAVSNSQSDHQSLLGLRHRLRPGWVRARRNLDQLRRSQSDVPTHADFRSDRKPGAGSRQQVGLVRRPFAGDRGAVPHRRQQRSRAGQLIDETGTITAGAAYHVQGLDLGAQGNITDRWSVYTGLVLMKTRVDHSAVPSNIGLPLAFVADQSFNILSKYKLPTSFLPYDVEVGGQATYRSQIYGGTLLAANAGTELPSYWRFDAFLEGKVTANLKWKLFANNIFNKLYYDAMYQSGAPFVLVAPGRALGVELSAKY